MQKETLSENNFFIVTVICSSVCDSGIGSVVVIVVAVIEVLVIVVAVIEVLVIVVAVIEVLVIVVAVIEVLVIGAHRMWNCDSDMTVTEVMIIFVVWIVTRDVIVTVMHCILVFMTGIVVTWKELLVPLWSKSWQRQASTRARHSIYTQQSFMAVFSIVFPPAHPQEARVGIHQVGLKSALGSNHTFSPS